MRIKKICVAFPLIFGLSVLHSSTRYLQNNYTTTATRTTKHVKAPDSSAVDNDNDRLGVEGSVKKKEEKGILILRLRHVRQMG